MRKTNWQQQIIYQLLLLVVGLFALLPIWGMARIALDGAVKGAPTEFRLWPEEFTLTVFQHVWENPSQTLSLGLLKNSLIVAGGAAIFSVILGASMAYAFARFRFPGRQTGLFAILVGALLPPIALMTPLYVLLSTLGLRTSLFGLMIVYAAFSMVFCIWSMRASFQAVPLELEEAAFLDGASHWATLLKVSLPLALPSDRRRRVIGISIGLYRICNWMVVRGKQ